jgi:hypothetical protein
LIDDIGQVGMCGFWNQSSRALPSRSEIAVVGCGFRVLDVRLP